MIEFKKMGRRTRLRLLDQMIGAMYDATPTGLRDLLCDNIRAVKDVEFEIHHVAPAYVIAVPAQHIDPYRAPPVSDSVYTVPGRHKAIAHVRLRWWAALGLGFVRRSAERRAMELIERHKPAGVTVEVRVR